MGIYQPVKHLLSSMKALYTQTKFQSGCSITAKKERYKAFAWGAATLLGTIAILGATSAIANSVSALFLFVLKSTVDSTIIGSVWYIEDSWPSHWGLWWYELYVPPILKEVKQIFSLGSFGLILTGAMALTSISNFANYTFKNMKKHWNKAISIEQKNIKP